MVGCLQHHLAPKELKGAGGHLSPQPSPRGTPRLNPASDRLKRYLCAHSVRTQRWGEPTCPAHQRHSGTVYYEGVCANPQQTPVAKDQATTCPGGNPSLGHLWEPPQAIILAKGLCLEKRVMDRNPGRSRQILALLPAHEIPSEPVGGNRKKGVLRGPKEGCRARSHGSQFGSV